MTMGDWQEFQGVNTGYVLELYERFRKDPSSVDAATRAYFERWTPPIEDVPAPPAQHAEDSVQSGVSSFQFPISDFHFRAQAGVCYPAVGAPMAIDKIVGAVNLAEC